MSMILNSYQFCAESAGLALCWGWNFGSLGKV
jgi:hypothetical protein